MTGHPTVVLGPDDVRRGQDVPPDVAVVAADRTVFPDGEQLVALPPGCNLAGHDVLVVHNTSNPQDRSLVSLLQLVEAVAQQAPASLVCFVPYLCYQRQDRRLLPGQPNSAELVLRLLRHTGAEAVLTVDRHSSLPRTTGLPIHSLPAALQLVADQPPWLSDVEVVVSADQGGASRARAVAERLCVPLVVLEKRKSQGVTWYERVDADLRGRLCLVVEDVASSGSTLVPLRDVLTGAGARMCVFVSHLLAGRDVLTARLGPDVRVATSDSTGDVEAEVSVMRAALLEWRTQLMRQEVG
jgi:ribose-phosphate pyrophosphokinase